MALGFGGSGVGGGCGLLMDPSSGMLDPLLRIPGRFFEQPSSARGVDVNDLLVGRRVLGGGRMSPLQSQGGFYPTYSNSMAHQSDSRVFHFPQRNMLFLSYLSFFNIQNFI